MKKLQRIIIFFSLIGIHVQVMPMTSKPNYKILFGSLERNFPTFTTVAPIAGAGVEDPYAAHPLKKFLATMDAKNTEIEAAKNAFIEADQKILDSLGELMGIEGVITAKQEEIAALGEKRKDLAGKIDEEGVDEELTKVMATLKQAKDELPVLEKKKTNKDKEEKALVASRTKLHQEIDAKMAGYQAEIRKLVTDNPEEARFLRKKIECMEDSSKLPAVKKDEKASQVQGVATKLDTIYKDYARAKSVMFLTSFVNSLGSADQPKLLATFETVPVIIKTEIFNAINAIQSISKGALDKAPVMWPTKEIFDKWEALVARQTEASATGKQVQEEEQKGAKPGADANRKLRIKAYQKNIKELAGTDLVKEKLAKVIKSFPDDLVKGEAEFLAELTSDDKTEILGKATISDLEQRMKKSEIKNAYLEKLLKALKEE